VSKKSANSRSVGLVIARARIVLCLSIFFSIYVDPATGGFFGIERSMLATLVVHLLYGVAAYLLTSRGSTALTTLRVSSLLDVLFAAILTFFTEGPTSPAFAMFLFAIVATGFWADLRTRVLVTLFSVILYMVAIALSGMAITNPFLMRAVYLAIVGYLIHFFGRERDKLEKCVREMEAATERQAIARSLHDGFMQALAGISMRLETCCDMLGENQAQEALAEIKEIQTGVDLEYDGIRHYIRALAKAGQDSVIVAPGLSNTEFRVETAFVARGMLTEHIIQILLEGIRNTRQHAKAKSAEIRVEESGGMIRMVIEDDGVGFADLEARPWTIASRVAEFGGRIAIKSERPAGAYVEIELPRT